MKSSKYHYVHQHYEMDITTEFAVVFRITDSVNCS